jgi:hypothetical protein
MNGGLKCDEMTPKERMKAFATGEEIDRIPCIPLIGEHACRLTGVSVSRYSHSAKLMADAQIAAFRKYRPDSVGIKQVRGGKRPPSQRYRVPPALCRISPNGKSMLPCEASFT